MIIRPCNRNTKWRAKGWKCEGKIYIRALHIQTHERAYTHIHTYTHISVLTSDFDLLTQAEFATRIISKLSRDEKKKLNAIFLFSHYDFVNTYLPRVFVLFFVIRGSNTGYNLQVCGTCRVIIPYSRVPSLHGWP